MLLRLRSGKPPTPAQTDGLTPAPTPAPSDQDSGSSGIPIISRKSHTCLRMLKKWLRQEPRGCSDPAGPQPQKTGCADLATFSCAKKRQDDSSLKRQDDSSLAHATTKRWDTKKSSTRICFLCALGNVIAGTTRGLDACFVLL